MAVSGKAAKTLGIDAGAKRADSFTAFLAPGSEPVPPAKLQDLCVLVRRGAKLGAVHALPAPTAGTGSWRLQRVLVALWRC